MRTTGFMALAPVFLSDEEDFLAAKFDPPLPEHRPKDRELLWRTPRAPSSSSGMRRSSKNASDT
jgi:hypothetical protein